MDIQKTQIYVATHKQLNKKIPPAHFPIFVGAAQQTQAPKGIITDNCGHSISEKNRSFCELTALYWIWKNSTATIVGLTHYRRLFTSRNRLGVHTPLKVPRINDILNSHDVILPRALDLKQTIYEQYAACHPISDLDIAIDTIKSLHPQYASATSAVINKTRLHAYNMFIAKKPIIDNYCEWLFSILFTMETQIDIDSRDPYQKRIFGFLSERLFNIWLEHHKFKIHTATVKKIDLSN